MSFFSTIADKAQSAINQTPLAGHIPGIANPSPAQAESQGGRRSLAFESLQHQIRSLGQQYTSTSPLQRIITLEKGVALDFDALARDGKTQSKELYTWGQDQDADLTDVTDRLAFLNFVHGSLSAALAVKLDNARSSLKALRAAETAVAPKRNIRNGLRTQIARIEHNHEKGAERRLPELKEQLARAEGNDEQSEKEIELLKRKAVRESEQAKWDAIQEYGEKLVLLSQAAKPILGVLPTLPPTPGNPYTGTEATAAARASLQHALDNYRPGQTGLSLRAGANLERSDTRSFGETHASELNSLATLSAGQNAHPGLSVTPPVPEPTTTEGEHQPTQLASLHPEQCTSPVPALPAPASGAEAESASEDLYGEAAPKTESAEEEKKRLEREERERVLAAGSEANNERPIGTESAEEEKKRLEREERERVLGGGASAPGHTAQRDGDELPPYQDFQQ